MTKSLLLLGGVLPAVQFVRRVSEYVENIHIIAQEDDAIVYSKHGEKFLYAHPENCHSVIKAWIDAQSSDVKQWLVIPCSEFFVQYIEEFRNTGFEVFALPSEAVDVFCDKKLMYIWLASLGVQISDFLHFSDDLDFTQSKKYIIKSSRTSDDYRVPFKTKVIKSIEELNFIRKEIPKHYWDNFVIQRLYENNQSLSYGGVWIDGKEVSSIIVKQVRQYPKGVTSYAVKLSDAADLQLIKKVIDNISSNIILHGFFELEFIKNEAGLYPIDLNPRLWGWSNFLFYNYPQLPNIIFNNSKNILSECENIKSWSNIWRDIPAIINTDAHVFSRFIMVFKLFNVSKLDILFWKDIKPEFSAIFKKIRQFKNGK